MELAYTQRVHGGRHVDPHREPHALSREGTRVHHVAHTRIAAVSPGGPRETADHSTAWLAYVLSGVAVTPVTKRAGAKSWAEHSSTNRNG